MFRELRQDALVDFFKDELTTMPFINGADRPIVERDLGVLIDSGAKRFHKTQAAKRLWKHLAERALSDVTSNLRGFGRLSRYFDEYVDYEDLLFAVDRKHRDHVIHSIWVMLLGFYLMRNFAVFRDISYGDLVVQVSPNEASRRNVRKTVAAMKKHEKSLWCLIALTHDLGYPIQKTMDANKVMEKMVSNFGVLTQRQFDYSFTILQQTAIDELLNTVSSVIFWGSSARPTIEYEVGRRLDCAKSLEQLDHGIMSAYLLQSHLDFICETKSIVTLFSLPGFRPISSNAAAELVAEYGTLIALLASVSFHTTKHAYTTSLNRFGPLLVICDELDEFSRYARSSEDQEWVEVGCRTELECSRHSMQIRHTFDNRKAGEVMEPFFKGKVGRLDDFFELSPDGIRKVSVTCNDVRKSPNVKLEWEKTASTAATGVARRTPGRSTDNVEGYLGGTVDLSL